MDRIEVLENLVKEYDVAYQDLLSKYESLTKELNQIKEKGEERMVADKIKKELDKVKEVTKRKTESSLEEVEFITTPKEFEEEYVDEFTETPEYILLNKYAKVKPDSDIYVFDLELARDEYDMSDSELENVENLIDDILNKKIGKVLKEVKKEDGHIVAVKLGDQVVIAYNRMGAYGLLSNKSLIPIINKYPKVESDLVCPKCGSTDVTCDSNGNCVCNTCGYKFSEKEAINAENEKPVDVDGNGDADNMDEEYECASKVKKLEAELATYRAFGSADSIAEAFESVENLLDTVFSKVESIQDLEEKLEKLAKYESLGSPEDLNLVLDKFESMINEQTAEKLASEVGVTKEAALKAVDKFESYDEAKEFLQELKESVAGVAKTESEDEETIEEVETKEEACKKDKKKDKKEKAEEKVESVEEVHKLDSKNESDLSILKQYCMRV